MELLKDILEYNRLKIEDIRKLCYDRAAFMQVYKGVEARIMAENNLSIYLHCYAAILNLCLVDSTKKVPCVKNMFGTLLFDKKISLLFYHVF